MKNVFSHQIMINNAKMTHENMNSHKEMVPLS